MKVSIITPLYNGEIYIRRAIEGILSQTYTDFEFIIIDDGSFDVSKDIVKEYVLRDKRIVYFFQENCGIVSALNKGIKLASGEYIAFCDQDDWWLPEKLEKQVKFLEEHKDIDLVYSDCFMFEGDSIKKNTFIQSRETKLERGGDLLKKMFWKSFIPAPLTVLMKKEIFEKVGYFDPAFSFAYDYHYWLKMLNEDVKVDYINELLAVWRDRPEDPLKVREAKRKTINILFNFIYKNPFFLLKNFFLILAKFIKSFGGLVLGRTLLKDATRK